MIEAGTMIGGSILRYCSECNGNTWHKIDMCGKCGATNTTKDKKRCRCCGGMFDSLVDDHPGLQGQCVTCVENYEREQKDMRSDPPICFTKEEVAKVIEQVGHKLSTQPDNSHYRVGAIDPCQYVEAMGTAEFRGACVLNILKYITRYPYKGTPLMDLAKAQDYLSKLIEHEKEKEK